MKVQVTLARSQREYADVVVEAPSVEIAEAYVKELVGQDSDKYADMVNSASWSSGDETFDEEIIDATEDEDDDDADVTVPPDFVPPVEEPEEPTYYAELRWSAGDVQTLRPDLTDDQAEAFLHRNEKHLRDRLCELGFGVMTTFLDIDGELPEPFKVGDRVYWTDPGDGDAAGGTFSRWGTIVRLSDEPLNEETIISLKMDDEGEVEALAHELSRTEPQP